MNNHIISLYQKWTRFYLDKKVSSFNEVFNHKEETIKAYQEGKSSRMDFEDYFKVFFMLIPMVGMLLIPAAGINALFEITSFINIAKGMTVLFFVFFIAIVIVENYVTKHNKSEFDNYIKQFDEFFQNDIYNKDSFNILMPQFLIYCKTHERDGTYERVKLNILHNNVSKNDIIALYRFMKHYSEANILQVELESFVSIKDNEAENNEKDNFKFFSKSS